MVNDINILALLIQSAVAGGGAWLAVKVELRFLGNSVQELRHTAERAHSRIDDMLKARHE